MYKSQIQFKSINIGNEWGQYDDIEANYQDIISRPFPFSTSKPVTKLLIRPEPKQTPIPMPIPAPAQFEKYDYDIEANCSEEKKEYKFTEKKTNTNKSDLKDNISMTTCVSVTIITYVLFFII